MSCCPSLIHSLLDLPPLLAVGDVYLDALGAELPAADVAEDGRHLASSHCNFSLH